jgi:hypothetical protein
MRENWVIFISVDLRQEIRLGLILLYIGRYCLAKNYLFIFDGKRCEIVRSCKQLELARYTGLKKSYSLQSIFKWRH